MDFEEFETHIGVGMGNWGRDPGDRSGDFDWGRGSRAFSLSIHWIRLARERRLPPFLERRDRFQFAARRLMN